MRQPRRTRALTGALLAGAALLTMPAPAAAAPDWTFGAAETTTVICPGYDGPRRVPGIQAYAGFYVDPAALPKVGEVFYGGVLMGGVAGCADTKAGVEVVPPVGVELAISAENPVRCHYTDGGTPPTRIDVTPAQGCGQQAGQGVAGGSTLPGPRADTLWPLYETGRKILFVEFPLRSSRALKGSPTLAGACPRTVGQPACPPERAGDNLQVNVLAADGGITPWLAPNVGLFVEPGPAGAAPPTSTASPGPAPTAGPNPTAGPTPTTGRLVTAPRALRIRRALRGIPVSVRMQGDGVVRAEIRTRRLRGTSRGLIARATRRARAGTVALRLRPSREAARALRRKRRVTATLRVTITPRGGAAQTTTTRITLRR